MQQLDLEKYRQACQTCHESTMELDEYGRLRQKLRITARQDLVRRAFYNAAATIIGVCIPNEINMTRVVIAGLAGIVGGGIGSGIAEFTQARKSMENRLITWGIVAGMVCGGAGYQSMKDYVSTRETQDHINKVKPDTIPVTRMMESVYQSKLQFK